jgi:hypothetical protein
MFIVFNLKSYIGDYPFLAEQILENQKQKSTPSFQQQAVPQLAVRQQRAC